MLTVETVHIYVNTPKPTNNLAYIINYVFDNKYNNEEWWDIIWRGILENGKIPDNIKSKKTKIKAKIRRQRL